MRLITFVFAVILLSNQVIDFTFAWPVSISGAETVSFMPTDRVKNVCNMIFVKIELNLIILF